MLQQSTFWTQKPTPLPTQNPKSPCELPSAPTLSPWPQGPARTRPWPPSPPGPPAAFLTRHPAEPGPVPGAGRDAAALALGWVSSSGPSTQGLDGGTPGTPCPLSQPSAGQEGNGKRREGNKLQARSVKTQALRVTQRVPRLRPAGSQGTNTKRKVRFLPRRRGQFSRASVAFPAHSCPRTLPTRSSNIQNTRSGFSLVTTRTPRSSHLPAELRRWVPATRRNAGGRNRNQSRAASDGLAFLLLPSPVCKE